MAGGADGGHLRPGILLNCFGPPGWPTTTACISAPPWRRRPSPWGEWLGQEGMVLQASALLLMVAIFWIAIRLYDREKGGAL